MSREQKVAVEVKKLDNFTGDARLFRLSPPMEWTDGYGEDAKCHEAHHVIVSATVAMFSGPETYIFPSNDAGEVVDWMELPGSFRGALDHSAALAGAGYSVRDADHREGQ